MPDSKKVVSLNPTWVSGGVLGAQFGRTFNELTNLHMHYVKIGNLTPHRIYEANPDDMPCHIYFMHTQEFPKLWYQCANSPEERDELLKLIEKVGATEVFIGDSKPMYTVANLSEAYPPNDKDNSLLTMMNEVNNDSRSGPNKKDFDVIEQTLAQNNPFKAQLLDLSYTPLNREQKKSHVANLINVKNPKNLIACAALCVGLACVALAATPMIDTLALKIMSALLGVMVIAPSIAYLAPASVSNTLRFRAAGSSAPRSSLNDEHVQGLSGTRPTT